MKKVLVFLLLFVLTVISIETSWIEYFIKTLTGLYIHAAGLYIEPVLLILIYVKLLGKKNED